MKAGAASARSSARRRLRGWLARARAASPRSGASARRPRRAPQPRRPRPEALVVHIGVHKTGTSTIQASLAASYDDLLKRGILYPRAGRSRSWPGHANLPWEALDDPRHQPEHGGTDALLAEIAAVGPRVVILSSEEFTLNPRKPAPAEWAGRLYDELRVSEVQVIGYVRPQWEFLESQYPYRVRDGKESVPFPAFVERLLKSPRLDYPTMFGDWRRVFADRLSVRPYDPDRFPGRDVNQDFWRAVEGLPDRPEHAMAPRNLRPGQREVEMLRLLRQTLADRGLDATAPLAPVFSAARRTLHDKLSEDPPFRGLTPELVVRIHRQFEESNRRFIEHFGAEHARLLEPPEIGEDRRPWTIEDASESERQLLAELTDHAIATLRRMPSEPADTAGSARRSSAAS